MSIQKGMVLCTKNPQINTNAIVISTDKSFVKLLTDFGNVVEVPILDLPKRYEVSHSWFEGMYLGYPFPTLIERVEQQIELLNKAKQYLKSKGEDSTIEFFFKNLKKPFADERCLCMLFGLLFDA